MLLENEKADFSRFQHTKRDDVKSKTKKKEEEEEEEEETGTILMLSLQPSPCLEEEK